MRKDARTTADTSADAARAPRLGLSRRSAVRALCGLSKLSGLATAVACLPTGSAMPERALSDAWHRAVDANPNVVHAFEPGDLGRGHLHETSTTEQPKPLIVGERVTVVTPDGTIHTLRVCDPASSKATTAPDCLNAFVARAVAPPTVPVPQRSL